MPYPALNTASDDSKPGSSMYWCPLLVKIVVCTTLAHAPSASERSDGTSQLAPASSRKFTTAEVLQGEADPSRPRT